ncbi:hypothetical protein SDC9_192501 [bioreactor metagenome]|uniref:Uncharacterized protein n=1 Tax=bioreactor metagenome TaxID=1076179 RepID=A0A645I9E4_9ZZZZ
MNAVHSSQQIHGAFVQRKNVPFGIDDHKAFLHIVGYCFNGVPFLFQFFDVLFDLLVLFPDLLEKRSQFLVIVLIIFRIFRGRKELHIGSGCDKRLQ